MKTTLNSRIAQRRARDRQLRVETLEGRLVLAVGVPDVYDGSAGIPSQGQTATEDSVFTTPGTTSGFSDIISRGSTGWRVFTDITRTGATAARPTDASGNDWKSPLLDFDNPTLPDLSTPFGVWRGPAKGGFANGGVTQVPVDADFVAGVFGGDVGAGYVGATITKTTFLMRRNFSVTQDQIDAGSLNLNFVCDDGCVIWINGVAVQRQNLSVDVPAVDEHASATGIEDFLASGALISVPVAGLGLTTTPNGNIIAVEVHNAAPTSSDIGSDIHLLDNIAQVVVNADNVAENDTKELVYTVTATDFDGDPATLPIFAFDAISGEQAGTYSLTTAGALTFTPAPHFEGTASMFYDITDGLGTSPTVGISVTVVAVNDAPRANAESYSFNHTGAPISVSRRGVPFLEPYKLTTTAPVGTPAVGWFYSDTGTDQDTILNSAWKSGGNFDPALAGWIGPARDSFGYGDPNRTVIQCSSTGTCGTNNFVTSYFYREFDLPAGVTAASISNLRVSLQRDDGAAVYLNGTEVRRDNLVPGALFNTLATDPAVGGADETSYFASDVNLAGVGATLSQTGNRIAAEVHQQALTSSDVSYSLILSDADAGVLGNDFDVDDASSAIVVDSSTPSSDPLVGTVAVNPNGTFTVTPASPTATGSFTFTYIARDPSGALSAPATVTITLTPPACANDTDLDNDGDVDRDDVRLFLANYGQTGAGFENAGDINCDDSVDLLDLGALQNALSGGGGSPGAETESTALSSGATRSTSRSTRVDAAVTTLRSTATRVSQRQSRIADRVAPPTTARPVQARRAPRAAAHDRAVEGLFG